MMKTAELLAHLEQGGVRLEIRRGRPFLVPGTLATPELVAFASQHKAELMVSLVSGPSPEDQAATAYTAARQLARRCEATGRDLAETVAALGPEDRRAIGEEFIARVERSCAVSAIEAATRPARTLITICRNYGVALRVDDSGLIAGPGAWRSLVRALTAHADEIAELMASGRANDA